MKRRFAEFQTAGADARNDVGQDGVRFLQVQDGLRWLTALSWALSLATVLLLSANAKSLPLGRIKSESQSESGDVNTQCLTSPL